MDDDPPWSASEAAAQINSLLQGPWPSPTDLRDAYLTAMSYGDGSCPGSALQLTNPVTAMQGCTATSGWSYQGHSTYSSSGTIGQDNTANWWISADFEIRNPSGQSLIGGGGVMVNYHQRPSGGAEYTVELYGTWMDQSQSNWMGDGLSAVLTTHAIGTATNHTVTLDGGISFSSTSLHFRDLTMNGDNCTEPEGSIGLYDGVADWYWLSLTCGNCGQMTYGSRDLGEACLNIDSFPQTVFDSVNQP